MLATFFAAGMILIDGINSVCLARLIDRADKTARITSRILAASIVGLGLITAASGIATQIHQPVEKVRPHETGSSATWIDLADLKPYC